MIVTTIPLSHLSDSQPNVAPDDGVLEVALVHPTHQDGARDYDLALIKFLQGDVHKLLLRMRAGGKGLC